MSNYNFSDMFCDTFNIFLSFSRKRSFTLFQSIKQSYSLVYFDIFVFSLQKKIQKIYRELFLLLPEFNVVIHSSLLKFVTAVREMLLLLPEFNVVIHSLLLKFVTAILEDVIISSIERIN